MDEWKAKMLLEKTVPPERFDRQASEMTVSYKRLRELIARAKARGGDPLDALLAEIDDEVKLSVILC